MKNNLNPNFVKSFKIVYKFETKQECKFVIRDDDGNDSDKIGDVETTIGNLMVIYLKLIYLINREQKIKHQF